MRRYESVVVVKADLPEAKVREETQRIQSFIESHGGKNIKLDKWGTKEIGYRMRRPVSGHYFCYSFETEQHGIIEALTGILRIADNVLKFESFRINEKVRKFKGRVSKAQASGEAIEGAEGSEEALSY